VTTAADSSTGGGGGGEAPVIESVAWTHAEGCVMGTGSDVTIVVTVADADTDAAELVFEGNVVGCTGPIDAAEATVLCPQVAPYGAMVTVSDPEGNDDTLDFMIEPCVDGMAP
jgi:hypothetical protein